MNNYSYQKVIDNIIDLVEKQKREYPFFIAIAGPDAVGKTTLSNKLKEQMQDSLVLRIDNYLNTNRIERVLAAQNGHSGHCYEMHNIDKFKEDIDKLKRGKSIKKRIYNPEDGSTNYENKKVNHQKYVIVESGIALREKILDIYGENRFGVFLSMEDELERAILKMERDFSERNYPELYKRFGASAVRKFILKNLKDYQEFITPTKKNADLLVEVDGDYQVKSIHVKI